MKNKSHMSMLNNNAQLGNFLKTSKIKWNCFVWGSWNFRGFQAFNFGPYTEIENSENSEIFSRLVNFKGLFLFEEVGNFGGFHVVHFGPYTEIKNLENSEIFSRLVNFEECVLLEEVGNLQHLWVFNFGLTLKSKTQKTWKYCVKWICFICYWNQHCPCALKVCWKYRSSHRRCSVKKGVLRNLAKFIGKHLCQRLFFNKVASFRSATFLKKNLWHRCFLVNFAKFLRTSFLQNTIWMTASGSTI